MSILSAYFNFVFRVVTFIYHTKRLNYYKRRYELKVNNRALGMYGFKHIKRKITANHKVCALTISGEDYEYMHIDEHKTRKLNKFIGAIKDKGAVEFVELNRVRINSVKQAKSILFGL